jgi:hypothetical protein
VRKWGHSGRDFIGENERATTIEIDGFRMERQEHDAYRDYGKGSFSSRSYKVTACGAGLLTSSLSLTFLI